VLLTVLIVVVILLFFPVPPTAAANPSGDEFVTVFVASVLEGDLNWNRDSYGPREASLVARFTMSMVEYYGLNVSLGF
jgi:hypothetical protein